MNVIIKLVVSLAVGYWATHFSVADASSGSVYQALIFPAPNAGSTWTILTRDGANRNVPPYLSSLGQGESGIGMVTSPPFVIAGDRITFTIRGHDGRGGKAGKNFIALVDARKGAVLLKTPAPANDALQERVWDVGRFKGKQVRIEVHDGDTGGAFAWLGIGRIDAAPALTVDFSKGLPDGWARPERKANVEYDVLTGTIPFRRNTNTYTVIPEQGAIEIPCGFSAKRLFFLGCTVNRGEPTKTYGGIEIHYANGSPDVFPLMCGLTLDVHNKLMSRSAALCLHASSDLFQHYLAITPRANVIQKIRLVAGSDRIHVPRITAITCETSEACDALVPLPEFTPSKSEADWIQERALSAATLDVNQIVPEIRKAHHLTSPTTTIQFEKKILDREFRSEGVAVADFNADGEPDIAAGNVYFAGPDWKMVPMLESPIAFNRFGYSDAFLCFADDVNHDGAIDLIVVGFPGRTTFWLQNSGEEGKPWPKHLAIERTGNESPAYVDVDNDGQRELVFMNGTRCTLARPTADATALWTLQSISNPGDPSPGHGLGIGDINGDRRLDIVIPDGWWQGPASDSAAWTFHPAPLFGGAQLCVADLDGDADSDILGSSAHGYGIVWTEQTADGWKQHEIDNEISQTHAIQLADIDRDGLLDFVTGKRFWAHNGHDPGSFEPALLCWFQQKRVGGRPTWVKHVIDFDSGVGLHFQIVDMNHDGRPDIITSNKRGVCLFLQRP